jgi:hypothetical protein
MRAAAAATLVFSVAAAAVDERGGRTARVRESSAGTRGGSRGSSLGPGAGAWHTGSPEDHGLSSVGLQIAAGLVDTMAPLRHCFLVVKNGEILHESYYGRSQVESKYESDSLAKTGTALLMMTAASKGLFDLDTPLAHYGVKPAPNSWPSYWWPQVTARHLLTQTGGCVTGGNSGVAGHEEVWAHGPRASSLHL